ncbi:NAD(P)H-dependent oxidoreductase [Roseisalinus antarcticus]|uniref:General stress protein 14 n=1 Tax=Roseisalinus antarcticus TaxID=254357 RepID=A0A1Y5RT02_9RHOB|nr:NAD(P)H-dependent oxidoreductase [Roseisalinus antarcticus]SLN24672.1 General stress protein 14 [Roseisalinus antarcticus]
MTTTLIVLAHPERRSFNGAWADATDRALRGQGDSVLWSDLNAMGFDPVEAPSHYDRPGDPAPFDVLKAQEAAAKANALPADVTAEIDKIRRADRIVFHFPLWWFAPPAMLKGWSERVLANGALHDADERFDAGRCRGKTALFCVTTGSKAAESGHDGKEGDVSMLLWPLAYTLRYLGFDVLEPRVVHGVHGYHKGAAKQALEQRLHAVLEDHPKTIADFDRLPRIAFNRDTEFDADGRLRPEAHSHSLFIRHRP